MGEGSSHELGALLLTEAVQFSLHSAKKPLFALFLDAKSAFDSVLRKILIHKLFFCGTADQSLIFINNRLESRTTYVEWDKELMGPIIDEQGVNKEEPTLETTTRFSEKNSYPWLRHLVLELLFGARSFLQ